MNTMRLVCLLYLSMGVIILIHPSIYAGNAGIDRLILVYPSSPETSRAFVRLNDSDGDFIFPANGKFYLENSGNFFFIRDDGRTFLIGRSGDSRIIELKKGVRIRQEKDRSASETGIALGNSHFVSIKRSFRSDYLYSGELSESGTILLRFAF